MSAWSTSKPFLTILLAALSSLLSLPLLAQEVMPDKKVRTGCQLTTEDYAIYSAVLEGRGEDEDPEERWDKKERLIISDSTAAGGRFFKESEHYWSSGFHHRSKPEPASDTERDFGRKLKGATCAVGDGIRYLPGYSLISHREMASIFGKHRDGWQEFYKRYPGSSGVRTFSRVGYNEAKNEALVYLVHSCGMLCGTGHLYLLAKQNERWIVRNKLMLWIS